MIALPRTPGSGRTARIFVAAVIAMIVSGSVIAASGSIGRPVSDVLEELRDRGLDVIYSSEVVPRELRVTVEPASDDPRSIAEEILAPHGLGLDDGPGGRVLVVRLRSESRRAVLRGVVVSSDAGYPVLHAVVRLRGTARASSIRPDGSFEISGLPPGSYDVEIEAVGFHGHEVTGVAVGPGSAPLTVEIDPRAPFLAELLVTPGRLSIVRQEQSGRVPVRGDDVVLLPTIGGDVSRVVELLPGVAAADNSAAFNVRGSASRDVSFVLDGLELYEPFHLESLQAPFSLIDAKLVDRIDVLGGGFTAEHGDRHGGVVTMSTAPPSGADETQLEIGTLNARAAHTGSLRGGRGGWSAAGRTWYPEAVRDTIELGEEGIDPRFADAYVRVRLGVSPGTVLSFHALGAYDRLEFDENDPDGGSESVTVRNRAGYAWVRALTSWSAGAVSESTLSLGRIDRERNGVSAPADEIQTVSDLRTVDFVGLRHDTTWLASETSLLKAGFDLRRLEARYDYELVDAGSMTPLRTLRVRPDGTSIGLFAAHRVRMGPRAAVEIGVRWDRQTYTNDNQLSPRFNLLWRPREGTVLRLGAGRYFQSQRIHELGVEDGETEFRQAELSEQLAVTVQQELRRGIRLRLDAYRRELENLQPRYENLFSPLELFPETEPDRVAVDARRAVLSGVELMLRAPPGEPLTWWAGYTLASAEDVVDGRRVPRRWDQRHSLKALAGYRWDDTWSLSITGSWHSGWPVTPVTADVVVLPDGSREFEPRLGPINASRYPAYARIDLKASRTVLLPRGRLRLELEVVNVTDRRNICCTDDFEFVERPDGRVETIPELNRWLGISPSFSVLWEF